MTKDEALDLALAALEEACEIVGAAWTWRDEKGRPAITAIKQARALDKKAENARELGLDYEPHKGLSEHMAQATNGRVRIDPVTGDVGIGTPPAQPAPVQEPVAWIEHEWSGSGLLHLHFERREQSVRDEVMNPIWTPLYTAPPAAQRKWVGLTDEEMQALWDRYAHMEMMRAIEAKLKEKNT